MKKTLLLLLALLMVGAGSAAARNSKKEKVPFKPRISLGVNAILEGASVPGSITGEPKIDDPKIDLSPGITFDVQLSKHSGIETGIYYRMLNYQRYRFIPDDFTDISGWRENHIMIPLYYKFYSRIVNFSVGADMSFNLDYDAKKAGMVKNYFAMMLKVSKDFTLVKGLYIEPLIQGGLGSRSWWGVGVGLKYRFK